MTRALQIELRPTAAACLGAILVGSAQLAAPAALAQSGGVASATFLGKHTYVAGPGECARLRGQAPIPPGDESAHPTELTARGYKGLRYRCDFTRITPGSTAQSWTVFMRCYEGQSVTPASERWSMRPDGSLRVRGKNAPEVIYTVCPPARPK